LHLAVWEAQRVPWVLGEPDVVTWEALMAPAVWTSRLGPQLMT
jgi:hypothetical protein